MIITHREFPNQKKYEMEYAGRPLSFEVGKLAELCNAAVLTKYGETTVLVCCTASPRPKEGVDYFPLNVDFEEKLYAAGRIPGGFLRREGRPSEKGTLASRMIDRPMRPLFPSDLRNDVVITCTVLSVDPDCSPEITAMLGASAATAISDVPWNGPIGGVVLGWDGEKYLFNPTAEEKDTSRMTVTIAATAKKIVMIEAEGNQIPEDVMFDGIMKAHEVIKPAIALIDRMVEEIGKPKFSYAHTSFNEELFAKIVEEYYEKTKYTMDTDDKNIREERWNKVAEEVFAEFGEEYPEVTAQWEEITYRIQKKVVKEWLLQGKRVDGRAMNQIRPLAAEVGLIPGSTAPVSSPAGRPRCSPSAPWIPWKPSRSWTPSGPKPPSGISIIITSPASPPAKPRAPAVPAAGRSATAPWRKRPWPPSSPAPRNSPTPSVW